MTFPSAKRGILVLLAWAVLGLLPAQANAADKIKAVTKQVHAFKGEIDAAQ